MSYLNKLINVAIRVLNKIIGLGYGTGSIKKEVELFIRLSDQKPSLVIDVGGNKGLYTEEIIKKCPDSEIHIFEPSKTNIDVLNNKFSKNQRVKINPCGLSNSKDRLTLYSDEPGSGIGSLTKRRLDHFGISCDTSESVEVIKFADYYNEYLQNKSIDLFKIDVEGHEIDVLKGCEDVVKKIRIIQFEFGGCNIDTKTYFQDFWYYFNDNGFDIFRISPLGLIRIEKYDEQLEYFRTTNLLCSNQHTT